MSLLWPRVRTLAGIFVLTVGRLGLEEHVMDGRAHLEVARVEERYVSGIPRQIHCLHVLLKSPVELISLLLDFVTP